MLSWPALTSDFAGAKNDAPAPEAATEALIYSVHPELVEGQSSHSQGLQQAQPERFRINQHFPDKPPVVDRIKAVEQLRHLLTSQFLAHDLRPLADTDLLQRLAVARQALTPPRGRYALPRIAQGVMAFRMQGCQTPYPDLKYACYGLARATDWDNRVLLDEAQKCDDLLAAVAALRPLDKHAFTACCRALQRSWDVDIAPAREKLSPGAKENGRKLGTFLAQAKR
ncbi:MAG: hypothetical protein CVU16_02875 [Betaproteobacteria bacterium HGW-Betaproteobacteria-10]|nr:MAG: hypothetical protein CVU16_02875 [Betaproteobacteria bacterium HGW-Betaproteobacteria-10]